MDTATIWEKLADWEQEVARKNAAEVLLGRAKRERAIRAEEARTRGMVHANYRRELEQLQDKRSKGVLNPEAYRQKLAETRKRLGEELALNRKVTSALLNTLRG